MFAAGQTNEHETATIGTSLINKVVGSGLYFAIAWVSVNYITHGISAFFAWNRGYTPNFSLNGLSSLAGTTGWCGRFIAEVFASAPIAAFFISIIAWWLFTITNRFQTHLRTFILWVSLAAFIVYYGHVLAGIAYMATGISKLFMGFVAMYTWARWETETITTVLILQAILSLAIPLLFVPHISKLSYSRNLFETEHSKNRLFLIVYLYPASFGVVLMLLASFPLNLFYTIIQLFTWVLVSGIIYVGIKAFHAPELQIIKGGITPKPLLYYSTLITLFILFSRLVLTIPVRTIF